jgi:hypothetical protein
MKKALVLISLIIMVSCGVQKNLKSDPYVGSYKMTVFEVDNIGDLTLYLDITKEGDAYASAITPQEGVDSDFEIDGTTLEEGVFTIEASVAGYEGYDIYFELTIEEDEISGTLMGMFDVEGSRRTEE